MHSSDGSPDGESRSTFCMIAMFGGFFTVPLYTLIQRNSPDEVRSRVIAGNNLINSVFMLLAGGMITVMLAQKHTGALGVYLVLGPDEHRRRRSISTICCRRSCGASWCGS